MTDISPGDGTARRDQVVGTISSAAFASGDQFVVGCWRATPVGPISDVMWRSPEGRRTLLASGEAAADYICGIYAFDRVEVLELDVRSDGRTTSVRSAELELDLRAGPRRRVPFGRPRWFTSTVEAPIARRLMGVEVAGTSPRGVREWYQARAWAWVRSATGRLSGEDLGALTSLAVPMGVGFSDPPPRPSIVTVRVAIVR